MLKPYIDHSKLTTSTIENIAFQYANAYDRGIRGAELGGIMETARGLVSGEVTSENLLAIAAKADQRLERIKADQRNALASASKPIIRTIRAKMAETPHTEFIDVRKLIDEAFPEIPSIDRAEIAKMI